MGCDPRTARWMLLAVVLASGCGGGRSDPDPATVAAHAANVQAWRQQHEADYRRDYVTIAGLHDLRPGTHTVGSEPGNDIVLERVPPRLGRMLVVDASVRFEPEPGVARAGVMRE